MGYQKGLNYASVQLHQYAYNLDNDIKSEKDRFLKGIWVNQGIQGQNFVPIYENQNFV